MTNEKHTLRPYLNHSIDELEQMAKLIREELRNRSAPRARTLREEIDPTFHKQRSRDRCVYVIELDDSVREVPGFVKENPAMRPDRPCLYVGKTSRTPEERFQVHKEGGQKAAKYPRQYGVCLRPEFYERYSPMTEDEALAEEEALATLLRREGYGTWQR